MKRPLKKSRGLLAVRVFRPPIPIEVITRPSRSDEPGEVQIQSISSVQENGPPTADRGPQSAVCEGGGPQDGGRRYEPLEPAPSRSARQQRVEVGAPADIGGAVRLCSGPWRVEEGWWTEVPADRDYWDVELLRGGIYRLYRDGGTDGWFIDARYD
jgi:hypothetical protein